MAVTIKNRGRRTYGADKGADKGAAEGAAKGPDHKLKGVKTRSQRKRKDLITKISSELSSAANTVRKNPGSTVALLALIDALQGFIRKSRDTEAKGSNMSDYTVSKTVSKQTLKLLSDLVQKIGKKNDAEGTLVHIEVVEGTMSSTHRVEDDDIKDLWWSSSLLMNIFLNDHTL